jgi:hypothetical protein
MNIYVESNRHSVYILLPKRHSHYSYPSFRIRILTLYNLKKQQNLRVFKTVALMMQRKSIWRGQGPRPEGF